MEFMHLTSFLEIRYIFMNYCASVCIVVEYIDINCDTSLNLSSPTLVHTHIQHHQVACHVVRCCTCLVFTLVNLMSNTSHSKRNAATLDAVNQILFLWMKNGPIPPTPAVLLQH